MVQLHLLSRQVMFPTKLGFNLHRRMIIVLQVAWRQEPPAFCVVVHYNFYLKFTQLIRICRHLNTRTVACSIFWFLSHGSLRVSSMLHWVFFLFPFFFSLLVSYFGIFWIMCSSFSEHLLLISLGFTLALEFLPSSKTAPFMKRFILPQVHLISRHVQFF